LHQFVPHGRVHNFPVPQGKLTPTRPVGKRQRLIQLLRVQSWLAEPFEHLLRQHLIYVPDPNCFAIKLLQELLGFIRQERLLYGCLQLGVLLRLLNLDGSFLKNHCHPLIRSIERETGIEPATNSLEGCDSTTELLPPENQLLAISRQLSVKPQPESLEPMIRIELMTSPLPRECSTN